MYQVAITGVHPCFLIQGYAAPPHLYRNTSLLLEPLFCYAGKKISCLLAPSEEMIMPTLPIVALFLLTALGLLLIPAPSVWYVITRSVAQGRRAGLASVLGIQLASLVHTVVAALGLSALLLTSALAFSVVKYQGTAYLIYLGLRAWFKREGTSQTAMVAPKSF